MPGKGHLGFYGWVVVVGQGEVRESSSKHDCLKLRTCARMKSQYESIITLTCINSFSAEKPGEPKESTVSTDLFASNNSETTHCA